MDQPAEDIYKSLKKKYLLVYLLACFADWLQGPYLYRLYANYGYTQNEISLFYIAGFASCSLWGIVIGHFADTFGRKRLCIFYSLTTSLTCALISTSRNYANLIIARISGGASTGILFSAFESWYVGQHTLRYNLEDVLMADIFSQFTIYNGCLAIIAGFVSSFLADSLKLGPLAPFSFAIPISLLAGYFCAVLWQENLPTTREDTRCLGNIVDSLRVLFFSPKKHLFLMLGVAQSLYEMVLYIFVFLWTPILLPLNASQGIIFAGFMLCIMIGSSLNSRLIGNLRIKPEYLLFCSVSVGSLGIIIATIGVHYQQFERYKILGSWICLGAFLIFEISVGIYYPSVSYLRGIVFPESHRSSLTNWFRLPSNLFVCLGLLYISIEIPNNFAIFSFCCFLLVFACSASWKFAKLFSNDAKSIEKISESLVI